MEEYNPKDKIYFFDGDLYDLVVNNDIIGLGKFIDSDVMFAEKTLIRPRACASDRYLLHELTSAEYHVRRCQLALRYAVCLDNITMVRFLVEKMGILIRGVSTWDGGYVNSLAEPLILYAIRCGYVEMTRYLYEHDCGVIIDALLLHSVRFENLELVKFFVEHGANINAQFSGLRIIDYTKLHCASKDIINYLDSVVYSWCEYL